MLQLFLQKSTITSEEWKLAYGKIESILRGFPLPLTRLESYNGFEAEQDKEYLELRANIGTENEHLSIHGDKISWSQGRTVIFYKQWHTQKEAKFFGKEINASRSILWFPHDGFQDDGSVPEVNGFSFHYIYLETKGAFYEYALLAVGILLEKMFPHRFFITATEQSKENVEQVRYWLETHLGETFDLPLYFNKSKLVKLLLHEYEDKKDVVCRLEHLYRKRYKQNMIFAIKHIGYEPTLSFYATVLQQHRFGTWGFSDVIDAWIAATEDLEGVLNLIAASKKLLLASEEEKDQEKAAKYDLTYTLKKLLTNFILWTPLQREQLDYFPNNKNAIETGERDLWDILRGMTGYSLDICPMYASEKELFEAFMYHDPKNGKAFKKIIEDWIEKNKGAYEKLKEELNIAKAKAMETEKAPPEEKTDSLSNEAVNLIQSYAPHEQFFIKKALQQNPFYLNRDKVVFQFQQEVQKICNKEKNQDYVKDFLEKTKDEKLQYIRYYLKKKRMIVTANHLFGTWLEEEENAHVLLYLMMLLNLKLYNQQEAYARYLILGDRKYWDAWR